MTATIKTARTLLELPPRKKLTVDEIQSAWKKAIKPAHPDHGGTAEQVQAINDARDLLLPTAVDADELPTATVDPTPIDPGAATDANTLVITPQGRLFSLRDVYVGNCGTVAAAIAYCAAAGWHHQLTNELNYAQLHQLQEVA